jgi:hypothetical protein
MPRIRTAGSIWIRDFGKYRLEEIKLLNDRDVPDKCPGCMGEEGASLWASGAQGPSYYSCMVEVEGFRVQPSEQRLDFDRDGMKRLRHSLFALGPILALKELAQ